jgi:hypothetical protein
MIGMLMQAARPGVMPRLAWRLVWRLVPSLVPSLACRLLRPAAAEQLQPMGGEVESQPRRDRADRRLKLRVDEFDHPARIDIDQMMVRTWGRWLIARAACMSMPIMDAK